jgi:hypothetical protein
MADPELAGAMPVQKFKDAIKGKKVKDFIANKDISGLPTAAVSLKPHPIHCSGMDCTCLYSLT